MRDSSTGLLGCSWTSSETTLSAYKGQPVMLLSGQETGTEPQQLRGVGWGGFMWGTPWGGWRTATTVGGGHPPCGQEEGPRSWGPRPGSRPAAGPPRTRRTEERLQVVNLKTSFLITYVLVCKMSEGCKDSFTFHQSQTRNCILSKSPSKTYSRKSSFDKLEAAHMVSCL